MICAGCGNPGAVVVRSWFENGYYTEVCNDKNCGDLAMPWRPDVYFRKPELVENLGDEHNPHGILVESKRHKANLLRQQGLREDGDRHHGSRDKGISPKKFKFKPDFERKLNNEIGKNVKKFLKRK